MRGKIGWSIRKLYVFICTCTPNNYVQVHCMNEKVLSFLYLTIVFQQVFNCEHFVFKWEITISVDEWVDQWDALLQMISTSGICNCCDKFSTGSPHLNTTTSSIIPLCKRSKMDLFQEQTNDSVWIHPFKNVTMKLGMITVSWLVTYLQDFLFYSLNKDICCRTNNPVRIISEKAGNRWDLFE